ncbi:hypothetical protein PISMIDRAFT_266848 [Pisolithus microcarpus 441]|uniref:Secreted protein n=1 Tax=Pisolithus microcarpus 441 TaxID=765257 RepID=A0A0C9Z2A8_9AGAM|nr:hypothetical protein PISMIDRAFT_266848 [Pisolithus microcarpus 441]
MSKFMSRITVVCVLAGCVSCTVYVGCALNLKSGLAVFRGAFPNHTTPTDFLLDSGKWPRKVKLRSSQTTRASKGCNNKHISSRTWAWSRIHAIPYVADQVVFSLPYSPGQPVPHPSTFNCLGLALILKGEFELPI